MSQPIHVHIIKEARALVGDERKWCLREMAFDKYGTPVCPSNESAISTPLACFAVGQAEVNALWQALELASRT